jgi:hypothetical protein
MPRYKVNKRYSAMYNATRLDYAAGAEVDLPQAQADWVNRDCPGTLTLVEPEPVAELDAESEPVVDVEPEQDSEQSDADAADEADGGKKPARNRAHTPARTRK